ncbi:MAG: ATP-dependent Clp protease ATP-binding subunit [Candidatus Moranbacteria bacterium]|nr:ATP-dependent Clp protease ATP-binding subunit [Candidatus Moranbacteria bacterium]
MLESKISRKLTFHARHSIKEAGDIASFCGDSTIKPKHLLFSVHSEKGSLGSVLLENMGFTNKILTKFCLPKKRAKTAPAKTSKKVAPAKEITFSEATKNIITRAYAIASQFAYPYVGSEHLVYAIIESTDPDILELLASMETKKKDMQSMLKSHVNTSDIPNLSKIFNLPSIGLAKTTKQTKQSSETPFLDQYGIDLTKEAMHSPDIITGRTTEIERMIQVLGRRNKNNPILIGEPGVGKTTLVSALAKKMLSGNAGNQFLHKRIIAIDLPLIVAGTSFRGEFEARLKEILYEATENPEIILFIDEIHMIVGAGNTSGGLDAANILKPALSRGDIQCIGATTFAEYKKHIEKDPAFERRFQSIVIAEPTAQEAKHILEESKSMYERYHNTIITPEAIAAAVDFSIRFIPDRFLPDKAFDLIDETASALRQKKPISPLLKTIHQLEQDKRDRMELKEELVRHDKFEEAVDLQISIKKLGEKIKQLKAKHRKIEKQSAIVVQAADVAKIVAQITHIPLNKILSQQQEKIANLEKGLRENIVGQPEVVQKLSKTLLRSFSGVSHPDRPLGSFLFLGPSGVGKTLAAKILSETLFEDKQSLIRLDMSEFVERHSIAQIIGAPAGYIGYGEGGKLTEKVRRKPYSVILFDEIEKAHPDVFNILLQILDEGMLTDAEGRKVSFRNTIIILTSNIGTQAFTQTARIGFHDHLPQQAIQAQFETIRKDVLGELKRQIRPELLNRLDHVIVFQPLDKASMKKIVELELHALKVRLAQQSVALRYKKDLIDFITEKSFTPEQGARLVRRNIQDLIENIIAETLLSDPAAKIITLAVVKGSVVVK